MKKPGKTMAIIDFAGFHRFPCSYGQLWTDLYERMEFVRSVECYDHSESYAEDVAENWVLGVL